MKENYFSSLPMMADLIYFIHRRRFLISVRGEMGGKSGPCMQSTMFQKKRFADTNVIKLWKEGDFHVFFAMYLFDFTSVPSLR